MGQSTKTIRVTERAKARLKQRGSMDDTMPEVVDDLLEENDDLQERVEELEAQLANQGLEKETTT